MKRTIVILIVVLALLALALLGVMIAGIVNGGLNLGRVWPGSAGLVNTQTLSLEGVDTLSVDYISESVRFYAGNGDEVVVKEYMNRDEQELFARITREGGTLRIDGIDVKDYPVDHLRDAVGMVLMVNVARLNKAFSKIAMNVVVMVMNYFFSKWIIFTGKKGKELSPPEREQNN